MAGLPPSDRPLPSSFDDDSNFYNESGLKRLMVNVKREPLVPVGCALTVAAFIAAWRASRRGDSQQVQRMFRARIYAQGFTVVCLVIGSFYFGAERQREREVWKQKVAIEAEEKKQRWLRELEARDEEEKELRELMERRKARNSEEAVRRQFRDAERKRTEAEATTGSEEMDIASSSSTTEVDESQTKTQEGSTTWAGLFGNSKSGGSGDDA